MNTLTADEVATFLRASKWTIMQLAHKGELAGAKVGKSWVFLEEDVIAFLRSRAEELKARALREEKLIDALKPRHNVFTVRDRRRALSPPPIEEIMHLFVKKP